MLLLMLVLLAMIVLVAYLFTPRLEPLRPPPDQMHIRKGIPKQIWSFWESDTPSPVIEACIQTWRRHCPDYEINVLTRQTVVALLPQGGDILRLPFENTPQRLSDFIRLHVLYEYGGYWVDASTIMNSSLSVYGARQQREQTELVGYYLEGYTKDKRYPVIESWFFGCVRHSTFVWYWREEFMRLNHYICSVAYVEHRQLNGVDVSGFGFMRYYLAIHVAAQTVLQYHGYPVLSCGLQRAEDGPLQYLALVDWSSRRALERLPSLVCPILKLRKAERDIVEGDEALFNRIFVTSSHLPRTVESS